MNTETPAGRILPWVYFALLAGASVFICRETFHTEATGHLGSMHGEWIGLARIMGLDWLGPRWWPYWGCGAPVQFAYAPLVPFLIALVSAVTKVSAAMALDIMTGLVYCLGPLALYLAAWRLTSRAGTSFLAAAAYLVALPSEHVEPASGFGLAWFITTRRAYRLFEWDDLPHLTCLILVPLAAWMLARALERKRPIYELLTALLFAAMMAASMFGVVMTGIVTLTVALAFGGLRPVPALLRAGLIAAAGYALASPWATPSLIVNVRKVALSNGEMNWSRDGFLALGIVIAATATAWLLSSKFIRDWPMRWMILFACPSVLIPGLDHYLKIHFAPQPQRYLLELEMALCLLLVFTLRPALGALPAKMRPFALAALAILLAGQVAEHRKFVAKMTRPVDMTRTIEYRTAQFFRANFPSSRVMAVGSLATWLASFSSVQGMSGQSYSTAPNRMEQIAGWSIMTGEGMGEHEAEYSILWMKAYGVQAVAVPGPKSPESWRPFRNPGKFEDILPKLWNEDDTTIYRVPQASASLAHVMPADRYVHDAPVNGIDTSRLAVYVDALDHPPAQANFVWRSRDEAEIRTHVRKGEVVSVQVNYSPGWRASVNGVPRPVQPDGLGLMVIDPGCEGDCRIQMVFDGGWEAKLTRAAAAAVLLAFACRCLWLRRKKLETRLGT